MMGAAVITGAAPLLATRAQAQARETPRAERWDAVCISGDKAGVKSGINSVDDPRGWNPLISRQGSEGWEPFSVTADVHDISMICFRRPAR